MKIPRLFSLSATITLLSAALSTGLFAATGAASAPPSAAATISSPISIAGDWRFSMDRLDTGITEQWFNKDLADKIKLPGVLQSQGYGDPIATDTKWEMSLGAQWWGRQPASLRDKFSVTGNVSVPFFSQPPMHYMGVAWYQRDIDIPANWAGKRVQLYLERPRWQSTVWVDDKLFGYNDSLVAPHVTDLGMLAPGKHRLTIRLDNRMMYRMNANGHSVSDQMGATWNGIAGKMELSATSPVWLDDVQVFPNIEKKTALVKVKIGNDSGQPGEGQLTVDQQGMDTVNVLGGAAVKWDTAGGTAEVEVPFKDVKLWDEYHPNLNTIFVQLNSGAANDLNDLKMVSFGFREISWKDKDMLLNGHVMNVRGTHFAGEFPLTGYPATDVASWKKIFQVCKDYGLNAMRFHSWCPPEAAFEAADEMGFYLAPEAGFWDSFDVNTPMAKRLDDETARMLKFYGNHPSFILFSPSNESGRSYIPIWATENYKNDPRRLYAISTGNDSNAHITGGAQFAVMPHTTTAFSAQTGGDGGGLLRTINSSNQVWFGGDYSAALRSVHIPILSHELGQWCAYPDFDQIKEFTGYLQPKNLEIFKDIAATNGVLDRNKEFAWASGKFQLACYKAELETNQRTPGLSGFELLDLHDYLGQGTALVGVVDALWNPKSYCTAEEYRRFAGPTVPLTRLGARVMTTDKPLVTDVEIAHYGEAPLTNAHPYWKIADLAGKVAMQGELPARDIPLGKNIALGQINADLSKLAAPKEYKLVVGLSGTKIENDWNIWVYPAQIDSSTPKDVLETQSWAQAAGYLAQGGKVLFVPTAQDLGADSPPLDNVPVFWNRQMNQNVGAMLGLWCDAPHAALTEFPTEGYCDWEWANLVRGVHAINIARAPAALKPIVSAVDDWNRNWKLGVIFEAKVGQGRLMVSAIDLQNNRNNTRSAAQLRRSLLDYMAGDKFQPAVTMTAEQANSLWTGKSSAPATGPLDAPPPEIDQVPVQAPVRIN